MPKKKTTAHAIADLDTKTLAERIKKIEQHLDAIDEILSDAVELDDETRKKSLRLQGDDEAKGLAGVIAFAEKRPEIFKALASEDEGSDPAVFETTLLRTRLANADLLTKLGARFEKTSGPIADSALYVTTLVKRPALAAYEIAKPFQPRDREYGKLLNDAVNFYHERAALGAKTRKAKKPTPT